MLLLECLAAAGSWPEARKHVEHLHRSLPPQKLHASCQPGSAADAVTPLDSLAAWRATCLVRAPTGRVGEDMNMLVSELATPQAKVRTGC